ncbi:rho guanine nucleotide exchange factor 3-like [Prorops nasuta]|uniref:rho guanine nucleotide exchange factor 3-like n=1 Tax=Prorops nasuta TaxID=863751 RepID=UPI0034CF50CD
MDNEFNAVNKEVFPEPRKRFWLRSRKRPKSDAISLSSMDISMDSETGKKKKRRRITEVASSIFASTSSGNKLENSLHRSFSIQPSPMDISIMQDEPNNDVSLKKQNHSKDETGILTLRSWVFDVAKITSKDDLYKQVGCNEIKRQEAIYELYCGENVLLNDLCTLKDFYYEPLLATCIFTSNEMHTLFGNITHLIEIHSKLRDKLITIRDSSGFTHSIGATICNWILLLKEPYSERCRSQVWARHILDEKRSTSKRFQLFLKKQLDLPRSTDLWTYLDAPRSRIVKYPILIKEILKYTPTDHADQLFLKKANDCIIKLLKHIDTAMGEAECKLAQSKINVKVEHDTNKCIEKASTLYAEGQLKDVRGIKYQCFLFDTCFVLSRPTRRIYKKYNLTFPVISRENICVDAKGKNETNYGFKVGDHLLICEDGHGKRHWIDSINRMQCQYNNSDEGNEKENKAKVLMPKLNKNKRKSTGSVCETHFSFSIRKSLTKQKRNSVGLI